jgi:hypothetical protein
VAWIGTEIFQIRCQDFSMYSKEQSYSIFGEAGCTFDAAYQDMLRSSNLTRIAEKFIGKSRYENIHFPGIALTLSIDASIQ